jgi:hypothetical protein
VSTFDKLVAIADELTEPRMHIERVPYWDANRNRKVREHRTTVPGLLAQLYDAALDPVVGQGDDSSGHAKPASRPPLAIEALSAYESIAGAVLRWVCVLRLDPRVTPQSNIRMLVGDAARYDLDTLEALIEDMRTWRRWAAVMTGWEQAVFRPRIVCPVCLTFASIRVNAERQLAFCHVCQHSWEGEALVVMAENAGQVA